MTKRLTFLALIFVLVSLACSLPLTPTNLPTPQVVAQLLVTADPNATATPTPFQPIGPTATGEVIPTASAAFTPEATIPSDIGEVPEVPTPVRINQTLPAGTLNLLVLGNDFRPGMGYRTDVIMLVSIHKEKGSISVISFPRDLYVTVPGWMNQRINTAFPHGGFSMMADTFEYNFGVRPTHYIMTNFQGFISIIDSLGGINVNVGSYLSDNCDLPQAVDRYCTVYPGAVNMNGATALWYVRSRHTSNDMDRNRRQQEVLYAIFARLMSLNAITRLPELYNMYQSSVETDLGVDDLLPYLPVSTQVLGDTSRIHRYSIGAGQTSNYITDTGAMVLLPNYAAINAIIQEAVFNP
jgi:LCP family protein required for cell wall assembly